MSDTDALQAALPDYEITKELGRGAMGIVYLGRHRVLNRTVAIKQLPPTFAIDDSVRQRFLTEARVVASLDHPHVVVIHDFVDRDGHLALVMEHLPNGTVWDQFLHHGLAAPRACGLVLATLAGVHHAHARGIMHRDIKPENLIFTHDWQLKVTDFGIAQVLTGDETMATPEGAIVGTPAYMAPEQAEGRSCGPPADVYASAAMLYEMLTGSLPFPNAQGAMEMATARLTEDPVPIMEVGPNVPGYIGEVTMHALARKENDRFMSAEEFGVALAEAAAETWGPEWMSESGTVVHGSEAIEHAARTTGGATIRRSASFVERQAEAAQPAPPAEAGGVHGANATMAVPGDAAPPAPGLAAQPMIRQSIADFAPITPLTALRVEGANLNHLVPDDIFNLAEIRSPPSPLPAALIAVLALVLALALALTGLGSDPAPLNAQGLTVQNVVVDRAIAPVEIDFTQPFSISDADSTSYDATFLGIPLGSATVADGELDPGYLRYTAAGVVELSTVDAAGRTVSFPVRPTNNVYLTAPFVAAALIALGAFATVQSNLRGLRARRIRIGPYIGLAISGAVSGASVAVLAMLVLDTAASRTTVYATAALGSIGSVAFGEAFRRWRRRRRLRRVTVASGRR